MKKSLVSALTTALVVGAASTTFAAANPFSDVPADHWAYDAVAQLAAEGVIEGYGDASYRGEQEITRFEMAQMVAKAMAKGATSAQLDKLAAEFAEELNSLGVRVAALEKKVDNVKFSGELRMTASRRMKDGNETANQTEFRLKTIAQVNKNWTVQARTDYRLNNKTSADVGLRKLHHMYAQGIYGKATINLGKFENYETVTEGMLWDDTFSGIEVNYGKKVKVGVTAARVADGYYTTGGAAADIVGGKVEYSNKKFNAGVAYYDVSGAQIKGINKKGKDDAHIWAVGAAYKFDKNWRLYGTYAANTEGSVSKQKKAYNIEVNYKGMNKSKPGSYGITVAYKHLGNQVVSNLLTYNYSDVGNKGWEIGANVCLAKNIGLYLGYMNGEDIDSKKDREILFSRVRFFF